MNTNSQIKFPGYTVLHKYTLIWFLIGLAFVALIAKTRLGLISGFIIMIASMYVTNKSITVESRGGASAGGWVLFALIFSLFLIISVSGMNYIDPRMVILGGFWYGIVMSMLIYFDLQTTTIDHTDFRKVVRFVTRILYTIFLMSIVWFIWDRRYEMVENLNRVFQTMETAALV